RMELSSSNWKTCEICTELKSSKEMFRNKNRCVHSICTDCIVKHINAKVEDKVAKIKCPNWFNCRQVLDLHTCQKIIPKSLFVKWCDLLCSLAIPSGKRSYCPNKKCLELVINECGGTVKRSECPKCKQLYCFQCNVPWPECNNCQRFEKDDKMFKKLAVSKRWIKCPTCNYYVERIGGCVFMRCRCGTSFCYKCGKKLTTHWCNCALFDVQHWLPSMLILLIFFAAMLFHLYQ
ncbi:hypothetical protein ACB092_04G041000, partial [Castanea dentata]